MQERNSLEDFLTQLSTFPDEYNTLQRLLRSEIQSAPPSKLRYLLFNLPSYIMQIERLKRFKYHYSPEVEVFADCLQTHSLPYDFFLQVVCKHHAKPLKHCIELEQTRTTLSHFLEDLYQRLHTSNFRQQVNQQQSRMNRTHRAMCKYIDTLFSIHARLVAVRVDLKYIENAQIEIEDLEQHLQRLYDGIRNLVNPTFNDDKRTLGLFSDLKGYIFKIEYGTSKGLHVHTLFFFDGSKRNGKSVWELARRIGEHWCDSIVGTQGSYWNCHDDTTHYERLGKLGIGAIHALESDKILNLKNIVSYFCKRGQYIKPKDKPNMKLVRKGDLPTIPVVKRGAPRKVFPKIISKRLNVAKA